MDQNFFTWKNQKKSHLFFQVAALCFLVSAAVHLLHILSPEAGDSSGPVRHGVFIAINILFAAGLVVRPPFFKYLFLILLFQQLYSHGGRALRAWLDLHQIYYGDWAVAVFMPITCVVLWMADQKTGEEK